MTLFFWPLNALRKQLRVETRQRIVFKTINIFTYLTRLHVYIQTLTAVVKTVLT